MFFLVAEALVLNFYDFPVFLLICKAKVIVLPTFQISGGFCYWVFYVLF